MAYLYRIEPNGTAVERWEIGPEPLVLGRGETVSAFVEDDALSRSHFLIVPEGSEYFLIDLDSRNGTWVGDDRVTARKLNSDEIISAGESRFYFALHPLASSFLPPSITALLGAESIAAPA